MRGVRGWRGHCLILAFLGWASLPAGATMGLAEWDVRTPGTNIVCSSDPFKADHGVCLRTPEELGGKRVETTIAVSHIEWWQYYPGYVVGKAKDGYFLFHETRRTVFFDPTEAALRKRLEASGLKKPSGRRLLPKDGWELAWGPILRSLPKPGAPAATPWPEQEGEAALDRPFEGPADPPRR